MSLKDDCDQFLFSAYEAGDGSLRTHLSFRPLAEQLGWEPSRALRAAQRLADQGYTEWRGVGGIFALTIYGIDAVERVRNQPAKQQDRVDYLTKAHEMAKGDPNDWISMWHVGEALEWERPQVSEVYEYLAAHGFLAGRALGGTISITEATVDLFEEADQHPDSPTTYFSPRGSLVFQGDVKGSAILSPQAQVHYTEIALGDQLAEGLGAIRQALAALDVDEDKRQEALQDVDSLESECRKDRPNPRMLRAAWESITKRAPGVLQGLVKVSSAVANIAKVAEIAS